MTSTPKPRPITVRPNPCAKHAGKGHSFCVKPASYRDGKCLHDLSTPR